ncbi:MAG: hypothetical protein WCS77_08230 [Elusimicrobiaceae bacterium]
MSEQPRPKITGILNKLMKTTAEPHVSGPDIFQNANSKLTGLGVPVIKQENGSCFIDMGGIKVFSGIVEFVRVLMGRFVEEYNNANTDILVHQPVNPAITPELSRMGVTNVCITARSGTAKLIFSNQQVFQRHLRSIFYAVQTAQWGGLLFPAYYESQNRSEESRGAADELPALLFPFHLDAGASADGYIILLEYAFYGKFLRMTIEDAKDSRLNLKRISHRVVSGIEHQSPFLDIDKTADQLYRAIHRECQNQQDEFLEIPARQPELFDTLIAGGLPNLKKIIFRWNVETMRIILLEKERDSLVLLSRILYLLQDRDIGKVLGANNLLEMASGENKVYLDVSRCGACLNISLEERRREIAIAKYLNRMPALKEAAKTSAALAGFRILLVHHATSEILGFIKALDEMRCAEVSTLFIKYKGIVPDNYVEVLFTLPSDRFKFYSLQRIATSNSVEANYVLSNQYSSINDLKHLDNQFLNDKPGFYDAMVRTSAHLFFIELLQAKARNQKLLVIEDGGYLAPLLNRYCLENKTLQEVLSLFNIAPLPVFGDALAEASNPPGVLFRDFIAPHYCGSIEHTRNGFDLLQELNNSYGELAFPALTIAISVLKNTEEARECAVSILNAFETILHSRGLILSSRDILLIGCRGNIGGNLMHQLAHRLKKGSVHGIDLAVGADALPGEFKSLNAMPDDILFNLDTFIGVTGRSVMKPETLEKIILCGAKKALFFISGSTKTVEFEDLSGWLQRLQSSEKPMLGDMPVKIAVTPLKDPQTGVIHGNKVRIIFETVPRCGLPFKDLYLLGDLMPLNFLYYGVPTELMDLIFAQLMKLTLGFAGKVNAGEPVPARLLAIDRDIDEKADSI